MYIIPLKMPEIRPPQLLFVEVPKRRMSELNAMPNAAGSAYGHQPMAVLRPLTGDRTEGRETVFAAPTDKRWIVYPTPPGHLKPQPPAVFEYEVIEIRGAHVHATAP